MAGDDAALGRRLAVALSFAFLLSGCATDLKRAAAPESVGLSSARLTAIDAVLSEGIEKRQLPGAVVLIARKGEIAYFRSFGFRDRESGAPMTGDAIFRIASMTKPITVAAALILVDEGRLGLEEPVSRHLPEFGGVRVGVERVDAAGQATLALEPARREMTVLDLMRHTSGLTYGYIGKSLVKDRYNAAHLGEPGQSNAEMAAKLARLPLQNQPGEVWDYGMSTDLLGRVVEVVSGMELGEFLAKRIFAPLGMTDSGFVVADPVRQRRIAEMQADPATGARPPLPDPAVKAWQSGGGGLVSTANDYARFCQMLLNGGALDGVRILSPKAVQAMTSDQLPAGIATRSTRLPAIDVRTEAGNGFGLGVMVRTAEGKDTVRGHVGSYTWSGGFGTYFWVDPQEQLFGLVFFQSPAFVQSMGYWVRIRNLAYAALD